MRLENLFLCIHYNKTINFGNHHSEIQPGDTEISYLAGYNRYSIIGFNADKFDDYGELCIASENRDEIKKFMTINNLEFDDRKFNSRSELLDYHENFKTDRSGQWKMISLKGTFENDKMKTKPQYNEEDINALEHVSMLIDEYMCCDDDKLTESGKALKELVEDFYSQWESMIEKYVFNDTKV